ELTEMGGRKVRHFIIPNSPGVQVAFWQEGDSLAAAFGPDVLTVTGECLAGNRSSLAANKKFQQQTIRSEEFAQSSLTWMDFGPLKSTYGPMPIPLPKGDPITVDDVLKLTGLADLDSIISRVGYKGAALWSESKVVGLGKADGAPMTLADLPPLPKKMNSFSAFRCNPEKALDQLMELVKNPAALAGEEQKVAGLLESLDDILGFRLKEDLVSQFGSLVCFYDDINGGLMGGGMTLVVQLNDGARTSQFIDQQMGRLEQAEEDGEVFDWPVYPYRIQLEGKPDLIVFDIFDAEETAIQMGAVQVIGNWLVISTMPQAVEAFRLRTEGRLATWTPDEEYQAAFAELPQEFTSITGASPREGYQLLLSLGTTFLPFLQKTVLDEFGDQFEELPFYLEEVPPAELIAQPLFPNVVVSVADADGATVYSRISTAGFPMGGGDMGMTTLAVGGVMAALLLPAVQSARGAARKAQAKNNLKQIGLAIHNYDSTYNHLPIGTIPNEDLKPEERFSWQTSILPYLEENGTYNLLDLAKPWNEDINEAIVAQSFPVFLDPNQGEDYSEYGQTHFVGMAGVGKNAPLLKVGQPGC
ncbi:MAG: DUF1559 domain-containing protein, partial [Planctomycetaceae bacterium]|nr:DUF1559 domain-containing protein [Planctomycetaceae bacterium]